MVQCHDCGALCGKNNPTSWRNDSFWCNKCARKHRSNAIAVIKGLIFLAFSAVVTGVIAATVLKSIGKVFGYNGVSIAAIGLGVGGVVLYFVMRTIAARTDGCLARMFIKLLGFLAYAMGVGMIIMSIFLRDQLRELCVEEKSSQSVEESAARVQEKAAEDGGVKK